MPDSSASTSTFRVGVALAVFAAIGFASKAIFVKLAYRFQVDAITLLTLRLLLALPFLGLMRLWRRQPAPPLSWQDRGWLVALGLLGYYLSSLLDFLGLVTVSASLERLILMLYPTFTVLLSTWLLKQRLTARMVTALAITYAGMFLVLVPDLANARAQWSGVLLVFLSTLSYALYLTWSPAVIARIGAMRFTELALSISALAMGAHFITTRPLTDLIQPWPVLGYALAIAIIATVLPIYALANAIGRIGSSRAAIIGSLGPVLTIVLSMGVLDEHLSALQWLGAAVVITGVWIVGKRR
ncbi:DMT family transporter [Chitiniphilus eburneus]|uniref:DMT family transporter n=1 Tax=Chitiniphilus eburneus TaxID=2571148 RepID=A0A4U0PFG5_9NEIS|nr:DMT family transporter [Chitiniphilus eburneus]TJZ65802.1 DMT family transporter [Chitiniphilus eburneus]